MEPTMRAFGMTWKEQPGVGGMIHHPIILNNIQVRYATKKYYTLLPSTLYLCLDFQRGTALQQSSNNLYIIRASFSTVGKEVFATVLQQTVGV